MGKSYSIQNNSLLSHENYFSTFKNISSEINQENVRYLILMRHGDRQDCDDEVKQKIPNWDDPELSQIGIEQASDIGMQLKYALLGIEINEINLFSSPFTRTIMTGLSTINSFDYNDKIKKNYYVIQDLAENGVKDGFLKNVKDSPLFYYRMKENKLLYDQFITPFLKGRKYTYNCFDFDPKLKEKEDGEEIEFRFQSICENLYKYISCIYQNKGNSLNIIITHQYGVSFGIKKLLELVSSENKIELAKRNDFNFCCSYCFKIDDKKLFKYMGQLSPTIWRTPKFYNESKNNKKDKLNNRYLIILRHGERIDSTPLKSQRELTLSDPELTMIGMAQANNIGMQLRDLINGEYEQEINEINVFASPSVRTLQTGILASSSFNYKDDIQKVIRIIKDLNEAGVDGGFENNKEDSPIYYHINEDKSFKDLYNKYVLNFTNNKNFRFGSLDFTSMIDREDLDPNKMKLRAESVITNIMGYVSTAYTQNKNTLNIVSTHQLNVAMINDFLIKEINKDIENPENKIYTNETNEKIEIVFNVGYCSCFIYRFNSNNEFEFLGKFEPQNNEYFQNQLIK